MGTCRIPRPKDPASAKKAEVLELLFAYVNRLQAHFEAVAAAHDLTPIQAKVILSLGQPEPMRCLADELGCDPSNVTALVDKLEERGLLTREGAKEDRRVKVLAATTSGTKLREALSGDLFGSVPGLDALTPSQVADLKHLLGKMCAAEELAEATDAVRAGTK